MLDFDKAITVILRHEGTTYTDDPDDLGGATKYGISVRFLKSLGMAGDVNHDGVVDYHDVSDLTLEEAEAYYKQYFFDVLPFDSINDEQLCMQIFDMGVNAGVGEATRLLQKAVGVSVDGVIGKITIDAVNANTNILNKYIQQRKLYYVDLCIGNEKNKKWFWNWISRILDCKV